MHTAMAEAHRIGRDMAQGKYGKQGLLARLRSLSRRSGASYDLLIAEARRGYAAGDRQRATSEAHRRHAGRGKWQGPRMRGGSGHKHGPSKSGRRCPKCGV